MVPSDRMTVDAEVARTLGLDRRGRSRRWLRRSALLAVLAALAFAIIVQVWRRAAAPAVVAFDTRPVRRGDLVVSVTATGTIEPAQAVDIGPEISGRVRKVYVDFNDHVTKGQILVQLDTDLLAAQVDQAESQLALATANVRQAQATREETALNARRARSLHERGAGAQSDVDTAAAASARAVAAVASTSAQERAARANLRVARTTLDKATIRAPTDGIVLSRSVDEGQTVVAALQAPVLLRLAEDLQRMQLVVDIDEADVGQIAKGQDATFTVAAYPDRTFHAKVGSVRNAPKERENVVTYGAVLDVDNNEGLLRPGMTGTAQITAQKVTDAVLVPNAALRYRPAETDLNATPDTSTQVYVVRDGRPSGVPVTPGPTDGSYTVLRAGGVEPGTPVIVSARAH
jgi:HlyD family secretion protein